MTSAISSIQKIKMVFCFFIMARNSTKNKCENSKVKGIQSLAVLLKLGEYGQSKPVNSLRYGFEQIHHMFHHNNHCIEAAQSLIKTC